MVEKSEEGMALSEDKFAVNEEAGSKEGLRNS